MGTKPVADKYAVSESWVRRLKHRRRVSGRIGPVPLTEALHLISSSGRPAGRGGGRLACAADGVGHSQAAAARHDLMAAALPDAFVIGEWAEVATVAFLFALSPELEA